MLGRTTGLTSDQLKSIQIVVADGSIVRCDERENSELFWALRGGCSSGFGIVTSLTYQLTRAPEKFTLVTSLPAIVGIDYVASTYQWFQTYASLTAPNAFTGTATLGGCRSGPSECAATFNWIYLGSRDEALRATLPALEGGFTGILNATQIANAYVEGTYLDAVLFWTGSASLQALLETQALDPWATRTNRRKAISLLLYRPLEAFELHAMLSYLSDLDLDPPNYMEWKAYGGVNPLSETSVFDARSPLRRGHLLEMHISLSYDGPISQPNATFASDMAMIEAVNRFGRFMTALMEPTYDPSLSADLLDFMPGSLPSYIDLQTKGGGASYFGLENQARLLQTRESSDPRGVFASNRAVNFLYPSIRSDVVVYVGAFDSALTVWKLDLTTGEFLHQSTVDTVGAPTWIELSADNSVLYAANEISSFNNTRSGAISAFRIQPGTGNLALVNTVPSGSVLPTSCYLDTVQARVYVSHSCGNSSTLALLPAPVSSPEPSPIQIQTHAGVSPTPAVCNATGPYLHHIVVWASRTAFVTDLHLDRLYVYAYSLETGLLRGPGSDGILATVQLPAGSGPRHVRVSSDGQHVFVVSEYANTLTVLRYDGNATLEVLATVSTLRANEQEDLADFAVGEVQLSLDNRYIYVSNRDTSDPPQKRSSLAVFAFNATDEAVAVIQHVPSGGEHPRHFALTASGSHLVVANMDTNTLCAFMVYSRHNQPIPYITILYCTGGPELGKVDAAGSTHFYGACGHAHHERSTGLRAFIWSVRRIFYRNVYLYLKSFHPRDSLDSSQSRAGANIQFFVFELAYYNFVRNATLKSQINRDCRSKSYTHRVEMHRHRTLSFFHLLIENMLEAPRNISPLDYKSTKHTIDSLKKANIIILLLLKF